MTRGPNQAIKGLEGPEFGCSSGAIFVCRWGVGGGQSRRAREEGGDRESEGEMQEAEREESMK